MVLMFIGLVFIILLLNLGGGIRLFKKATSKLLFIAAATFLSIYGIANTLFEEKSATGVLEGLGLETQNSLISFYLYVGIALLVWGLIRKCFEIKGLVKKD
ncbi:hypothetical protein AB0Z73_004685 [Salmonella enterica]|nr:hypothetical protein [Salmonella enterica]ECN1823264.1 hypothetical protein [Salmonella enterica subsp. enterica serovar Enteritidis]EKK5263078.1 hypothetical protein [Cronobacter sakazakii]EBR7266316.1 hypothetical protein [Salmonella enterica]EGE9945939.1 hypothetical protein [Salmonella enterica]